VQDFAGARHLDLLLRIKDLFVDLIGEVNYFFKDIL
jgi:hypothetical protein